MASNKIPENLAKLLTLGGDAAKGAALYGVAINLTHNTGTMIRLNLTALEGDPTAVPATLGSIAIYDASKSAKVLAKQAENDAEQDGRAFISAAIGALESRLGKQWNSAWNAVGFTDGSLAIPKDPMANLISLRNYFTANPTHEVTSTDGVLNISASAADARITAISNARSAYNNAEDATATAHENQKTDKKALYNRMTGLRAELDQLLGDDDPRWYAFGFSRPADGDSPGPISTLTLTPAGAGVVIANWTHAIRAERYRVFKKALGTDPNPVQIASDIEGLTFTLLGLPSGATVEVYIVPANETGDGPPSPTVPAVVP